MYEIEVHHDFCAAHAVTLAGQREPLHGHNWHVVVVLGCDSLDDDEFVCDFHVVHEALDRILAPMHNQNLNATPPFDHVNPTAERVARHIADELLPGLADPIRLVRVSVTEAPGCVASYRPSE
jgi:6-pyruvoyltetrahydropterin/6-carboxytetrahydropterin synthase